MLPLFRLKITCENESMDIINTELIEYVTGIVANPKNVLHIVKKKAKKMVGSFKNNHGPVIEENVGSHIIDALDLICEDERDDDFYGFLCSEIRQD